MVQEMGDKIGSAYDALVPKLTWQAAPQFVNDISTVRANANLSADQQQQ